MTVPLIRDIAIRRLAERDRNVVHWQAFERGGRFFALATPDRLIDDMRAFFGRVR
jgi:hypothetical protein